MKWALLALAACSSTEASSVPRVETTVAAGDYIGPQACGECHPDQYARWQGSLHRVMNARASDAGAVIGNFDDAALGDAHFTRDASGYFMTLRGTRYRVTRTIGRRGLQEYVGVRDGDATEVRLPFGWWPRAGGWQMQSAFDPWVDEAVHILSDMSPAKTAAKTTTIEKTK